METPENRAAFQSASSLADACRDRQILEGRAVICDSSHNLVVDCGCMRGLIPREEGAIGMNDGSVRDIAVISRVNRPVCFLVTGFQKNEDGKTIALLSRRAAQELCMKEYVSTLVPGDIVNARITHLETFGAFADIGCGIVSLLPIDMISVSRIDHPRERFSVGMDITAVIKAIDNGRISLTHKELLGTWQENAKNFSVGETVVGVVRSVKDYGVFIELSPNLSGLAEYREDLRPGDRVSVYIKAIVPERQKVKLIVIRTLPQDVPLPPIHYYKTSGSIQGWHYADRSPAYC